VVCASLAESQAGGAASGAKPPGEALAEVVAAAALAVNMVSFEEFVLALRLELRVPGSYVQKCEAGFLMVWFGSLGQASADTSDLHAAIKACGTCKAAPCACPCCALLTTVCVVLLWAGGL